MKWYFKPIQQNVDKLVFLDKLTLLSIHGDNIKIVEQGIFYLNINEVF